MAQTGGNGYWVSCLCLLISEYLCVTTVAKEKNKKDTKQLSLLIWHLKVATHHAGVEAGIPQTHAARAP